MKIIIFSLLILFTNLPHSWAQSGNRTSADQKPNTDIDRVKNVVYLELLGNGGIYSFNYERRLGDKIWGRAGASYFPAAFDGFASFPIGASYLFGKQTKYFELGIGTTLFYAGSDNIFGLDFDDNEEDRFSAGITGTIGYRFQPPTENLFFKVALIPAYIPIASAFAVSAGLSLGYSF